MKEASGYALLCGALGLWAGAFFAGCAELPGPTWEKSSTARANGPDWSNESLNMMIDKYGPPDRIETGRVVWVDKGPWTRMAVWDDMQLRQFSMNMDDNIEDTLAYMVPDAKRDDVQNFGAKVKVSREGAELSSRSYSEERNFLALNLADEIVRGMKTPGEAKTFYVKTLQLAEAGKSSPYMKGLLFQPPPVPAAP